MLSSKDCLVSLVGKYHFADTDTTTHIARIVSKANKSWKVLLLTDHSGEFLLDNNEVLTVPVGSIVSNKTFKEITPKRFYQVSEELVASGFASKERTLDSTTRIGFGSGIQGIFIQNEDLVSQIQDSGSKVFEIVCDSPYSIQDAEHDDSITLASLNTNRYLDKLIQYLQSETETDIETLIKLNQSTNLITLWNIALFRTGDSISQDQLDSLLAKYLKNYLNTKEELVELPINSIMRFLGYTSILTRSNKLLTRCISYNYENVQKIPGHLE